MDLLTTTEVAKALNLSSRQIRKYVVNGRLKAQRVGRTYAITRKDFEAFCKWYRENEPKPGPDPRPPRR